MNDFTSDLAVKTSPKAFASDLRARLDAVDTVDPQELCRVIGLSLSPPELSRIVLNEAHRFLLRRTLQAAVEHVPYYRNDTSYKTWADVEPGVAPDICHFPILNRKMFDGDSNELLAENVRLRGICHTSGTTGSPVQIYKSFEETEFLQNYFGCMIANAIRPGAKKPLSFSLPNVYHGSPTPLPSPGLSLVGGVTDDTLIRDALSVLERTHNLAGYERRISTLSGLGHHILFLTNFMLEQGKDPKSLSLRAVNVTGGYLSTRWRRFLEEAWGPIIQDRFSLTETIAGASRIRGSETFVFDPHIFPEVIGPDYDDETAEIGRLVLTNLYPFVIMQPLIRYETSDLVARVENHTSNTLSFDYLGRVKNCISLKDSGQCEWLIFSAKLHDILSEIPDIRVFDWFSNVRSARDRSVGSLPMMSLKHTDDGSTCHIRIALELRYSPHTHLSRVEELRTTIIHALRQVPRTELASRMDDGRVRLEVSFLPPDGLETPPEIKV